MYNLKVNLIKREKNTIQARCHKKYGKKYYDRGMTELSEEAANKHFLSKKSVGGKREAPRLQREKNA